MNSLSNEFKHKLHKKHIQRKRNQKTVVVVNINHVFLGIRNRKSQSIARTQYRGKFKLLDRLVVNN